MSLCGEGVTLCGMRCLAEVGFFLLLALPAQASTGRVSALGKLLTATLPSLPPLLAAAPAPTPAMLDASKVAALISRASALTADAAPAPASPARPPLKVLEAVNSTLRDFTPDQIGVMTEEKLRSLASVILDGVDGREPPADLAAAIALSEANLSRVESLRGLARETLHNPGHNDSHGDMITVRGVPETVKRHDADGTVFRHYTTGEGRDAILRERTLRNGFVPYVQSAPGVYRKTYRDLAGVFLTLPRVAGDRVGVPARDFTHYVDLLVPRGLPVLEIEAVAIYLVPLPGRTRDWIAGYYRLWASGGGMNSIHRTAIETIEDDGGVGPSLAMPIEIVGHGRAAP